VKQSNDFLFGRSLALKWKEVFKPGTYQKSSGVITGDFLSRKYDYILTLYPDMKAGLELCCGNGRRIRGGRAAMKNIFGINDKPMDVMWRMNGVSDFCKVGTVAKIPYKDNTFDFVCYPIPLKYNLKALREMKRVCNGTFYLQLDCKTPQDKWIDVLVKEGYYIEVFCLTDTGDYITEGRFLRGR